MAFNGWSSSDVEAAELDERVLVAIIADMSGSMGTVIDEASGRTRADELRTELQRFLKVELANIPQLARVGEIAFGSFKGSGQRVITWHQLAGDQSSQTHPFYYASQVNPALELQLAPGDQTPLGEAVIEALGVIQARKAILKKLVISYPFRPILFILTDGQPSTSIDSAQKMLREYEQEKKVVAFALGTHGANDTVMEALCPDGYYSLKGRSMHQVIDFLSKSLGTIQQLDDLSTAPQIKADVKDEYSRTYSQDDAANRLLGGG